MPPRYLSRWTACVGASTRYPACRYKCGTSPPAAVGVATFATVGRPCSTRTLASTFIFMLHVVLFVFGVVFVFCIYLCAYIHSRFKQVVLGTCLS